MNVILDALAGIGVPGFIFLFAIRTSPYVGSPAITNALKRIGFNHSIITGVFVLVSLGVTAFSVTDLVSRESMHYFIRKKLEKETPEKIIRQIKSAPVSNNFKRECIEYVHEVESEEDIKLKDCWVYINKYDPEYSNLYSKYLMSILGSRNFRAHAKDLINLLEISPKTARMLARTCSH